MPESHQIIDLGRSVARNATMIDTHEKHFDRLDASMEKLTEVSITLKEIVKHQDYAIRGQKMAHDTIVDQAEKRRDAYEHAFSEIKAEIHSVQDGLETKIDSLTDLVNEKLRDNKSFWDKWKWMIVGASFIVFLMIDHFPFIQAVAGYASSHS
jgi:hypothetical protein